VSCHSIRYLDKSKGIYFYCPNRYTKIVEMRHTVFLEDEVITGSMREIRLEEKWVYVPTPMVVEPFFLVPNAVTPIVQGNVVVEPIVDSPLTICATPIVSSLMAEINEEEQPGF
jgi:hypothetical protein